MKTNRRPKINENNLILMADSYKFSHHLFMPEGSTYGMSYIESRGGLYDYVILIGVQYYLNILARGVTMQDIDEAEPFIQAHGLPFNRKGWEKIVNVYGGKLPVIIRSAPEGTKIKNKNVLLTIETSVQDEDIVWLPSFLETLLLKIWYPTTVATISNSIRETILDGLRKTSDNVDEVNFKLHDFGYRGVSSEESAGLGGLAHLVNFMGTDTVKALVFARNYYDADMAGFSIPATEHSVMTVDGEENEPKAFQRFWNAVKGKFPLAACVSDGYNIYRACKDIWGGLLKEEIVNGETVLVVRPDSGTPWVVVPKIMQILDKEFGHTVNEKGYKVLNSVRVIQGDGIDETCIKKIYDKLFALGYSATNIAFGMGGALLQHCNRDTQKFAMKACALEVNGIMRELSKNPIDDPGKASKQGQLELVEVDGEFMTVRRDQIKGDVKLVLRTVFKDGEILIEEDFDTIRQRVIG